MAGFDSFEDIVSTRTLNAGPIQDSNGPVTRARAKRFKEGLSVLIQLWAKNHLCCLNDDYIGDPQKWVSLIQTLKLSSRSRL